MRYLLATAVALLLAACQPHPGYQVELPTPMECGGDPADPLHCSAAGGETVCDVQPDLCEP